MSRTLATAPPAYSPAWANNNNALISNQIAQCYRRGQDVEIPDARLILVSPDGTRWSITVDNAGVISATSL